jgi:hypothetical protein
MADVAKTNEVIELVSFFGVSKTTEALNVMDIQVLAQLVFRYATALAGVMVTATRSALLRSPVLAIVRKIAALPVGVMRAYVGLGCQDTSTLSGARFASLEMANLGSEVFATDDALSGYGGRQSYFWTITFLDSEASIVEVAPFASALQRTEPPASIARGSRKCLTALLTRSDVSSWRLEMFSEIAGRILGSAFLAAVLAGPRFVEPKVLAASRAIRPLAFVCIRCHTALVRAVFLRPALVDSKRGAAMRARFGFGFRGLGFGVHMPLPVSRFTHAV